ncbi:acetolactate synthase 2 small subunit [Pseudoalteromonas sp. CNC9-20]|uniref:acetolactate synthase 2 small subunit n=1 Tax=Pseudoalteromonas sp. CNC9-20 TaxID=2917750 RepID=UPI001EF62472|nr:acetolactate synthase 2 small subunit [Pseudoalteromonas sp. CNC9-20]MCG7569731.1 acetolactate synthase 2 small subunit [Pseudoalteromonas sp. CNC9-20]
MKHRLTLHLANQTVAVERFLRVARHRGFKLTALELTSSEEHYAINMTVDSDKPIYLLTQQLNKLVDVQSVTLQQRQQQAI